MKNIRIPMALVVVAVLVLALPLVASADNSWSKYHWNIATADAPLVFGDNLTSSDWKTSLVEALGPEDGFSGWNDSVIKNTSAAGKNTDCVPVLGSVEVCNAEYGDTGWLGIAQIWVYRGRDGHIAQALVKVNDTFFNSPQHNTQAWRDFVVCQEVGHTLGLAHQDEDFDNENIGTCMDYTSDPNAPPSNLHPDQHDLDVLIGKYAHLNGTDDDDGGKKGNNGGGKGKKGEPPGQDVRQWGKAISTDGKGRPDLFEKDLGNGDKLFTHVLWAD